MITATCPECSAQYKLTAQQVGPQGRTLKCAKCGHKWFMEPVKEEEAENTSPATQPEETAKEGAPAPKTLEEGKAETKPETEQAAPPKEEEAPEETDLSSFATIGKTPPWVRRLLGSPAGLLALGGLVLGGLIGLSVYRLVTPPVMQGPQTEALQQAPIPENAFEPEHLILSDLKPALTKRGDTWVLAIEGNLTNTSRQAQKIPQIKVQLVDAKGQELDFWPAELTADNLGGGESTTWSALFLNPPLQRLASFRAFFISPVPLPPKPPEETPAPAKGVDKPAH